MKNGSRRETTSLHDVSASRAIPVALMGALCLGVSTLIVACVGDDCDGTGTCPGAAPTAAEEPDAPAVDGGVAEDDAAILVGTPRGEVTLTLPDGRLTLVHGRSVTTKVAIERSKGFTGPVTIGLVNAPPGITSEPLVLSPEVSEGTLTIDVGMEAPQGDLANVLVEASSPDLKESVTSPLTGFVRGAPGEIDTTFAEEGVLKIGRAASSVLVDPASGDIYVNSARRFDAGGKVETKIASAEGPVSIGGKFIYGCSANGLNGEPTHIARGVRVSIPDGTADAAFRSLSPERSGRVYIRHCLGSPSGSLAAIGYTYSNTVQGQNYGYIAWFDTTGWLSTTTTSPTIEKYENGLYIEDGVVLATSTGIVKYKTKATTPDLSFGAGGKVTLNSGGTITSIAPAPDKKLIVANATYTARITSTGGIDGAFVAAAIPLGPTAGFGKVTVQADGKVLKAVQLGTGDGGACAVVRYLPTGALDTTFGDQGIATYDVTPCSPTALAVQPSGRIVVGGADHVLRVWD